MSIEIMAWNLKHLSYILIQRNISLDLSMSETADKEIKQSIVNLIYSIYSLMHVRLINNNKTT